MTWLRVERAMQAVRATGVDRELATRDGQGFRGSRGGRRTARVMMAQRGLRSRTLSYTRVFYTNPEFMFAFFVK